MFLQGQQAVDTFELLSGCAASVVAVGSMERRVDHSGSSAFSWKNGD